MCELVLSLNDASARFPGGVRPLDEDPALSFLATIDAGVGSNPGGEFDAPENDAFLLTSGIELNDGSAASSRRASARPPSRRVVPLLRHVRVPSSRSRASRARSTPTIFPARARALASVTATRARVEYRRKRSSRGNVIVRARVVARASSRARDPAVRASPARCDAVERARVRVDRDALLFVASLSAGMTRRVLAISWK